MRNSAADQPASLQAACQLAAVNFRPTCEAIDGSKWIVGLNAALLHGSLMSDDGGLIYKVSTRSSSTTLYVNYGRVLDVAILDVK